MKEAKIILMENPTDGSVPDQHSVDSYLESGFYIWPDSNIFFVDKMQGLANYLGRVPAGWSGYFREPGVEPTAEIVALEDYGSLITYEKSHEAMLQAIAVALKPELAFKETKDEG